MPKVDHISNEELKNSSHSEYNDGALMELASRVLDTSVYQLLRSTMLICNGQLYEQHLDAAFGDLVLGSGRLPIRYRKYIIEVLVGDNVFVYDPADGNTEALIIA